MRPLALAAILCLAAGTAHGHAGHSPRGERVVKVAVEPDRLRVVYTILYGPLAALITRREMDRDGNAQVSAQEADRFARDLQSELERHWEVRLDGRTPSVTWKPPSSEAAVGEQRTDPFPIELEASVEVAGGEQLFVLVDRLVVRRLESSTYTAVATPPATLVAAGPEREPRSLEPEKSFHEGGAEDVEHVFAVRFQTPAPPEPAAATWAWAAGAAAVLLLFLGGAVAFRRRRRVATTTEPRTGS